MNKIKIFFFSSLFLLGACSHASRGGPIPPSESFKPIVFYPPAPERIELENGMIVYLLEDHELPLINISACIRTGSVYEPPELAGLAAMTGGLMRTGGTLHMTAGEVDRQLEDMSAQLSVGIGLEQGSASLSVLKEDFEKAFSIFSQILMQPAFEKEKFEIARNNTCQGLRQLPDNPQNLAFREYKKLLYSGNPRGAQPSIASVKKIQCENIVAFHRKFFHPNTIMLAISGDFSRGGMLALIRKQFGGWKKFPNPVPMVAPPSQFEAMKFYHLQKQLSQSTIVMGHFAPPKTHPDYFPFQVLDFIIGSGGFTSRLFSQVRTAQGLAYSVGSFYRGDIGYGVFGAYCMTKAGSTNGAFSLMMKILEDIKNRGIAHKELAWAKESILNNFIFSFTSSAQIAAQQMSLEYDGLPPDFISTAPDRIRSVTIPDLKRVADTWLTPDRMLVMIVGDKAQFDVQLDAWQWGRVNTITSDILNEK